MNPLFLLMNKDDEIAKIEMISSNGIEEYQYVEKKKDVYFPHGSDNFEQWLAGRQAAKHRNSVRRLMRQLGIMKKSGFISMTRCTSLNDTFWVKESGSSDHWSDVSLYRNKFDETISRISFDGIGMYGTQSDSVSPEFSTAGKFDKCWVREDGRIFLVKRGSSGFANAGMEPYSEKIVSDICDELGINHVSYELVMYRRQLTSKCKLFTSEENGFVSAGAYFNRYVNLNEQLREFEKFDAGESFRDMLVLDALVMNTDRHPGNFGFLADNDTGKIRGMAPLFDHNRALFPRMMKEDDLMQTCLDHSFSHNGMEFAGMARAFITPRMKSALMELKNYEIPDIGFGFPKWKRDVLNRMLSAQIDRILGRSKEYFFSDPDSEERGPEG